MGHERFGLGITNCRAHADVLAGVELAEQLGAEIAFIAEDINCRDAFQLCALAASRTTRIRLSTGVTNPYTRTPTSLAMSLATLDEVSAGRAALGLGTGSPTLIEEQMGIPHAKPVRLMQETTQVVRALLTGDPVAFDGEILRYRDARLEVRPVQDRIPIFFAAMGPQVLEMAGQVADGVLLNVGASTEYVRWAIERVRAGERAAGRDPGHVTIAAWLTVYLTDDYADGLERARRWLATMLSIPRQGELLLEHAQLDMSILPGIRKHVSGYPHRGDPRAAARFVPVEVAEKLTVIGDATRARSRLEEYRDAGVELPVLPITAIRALA